MNDSLLRAAMNKSIYEWLSFSLSLTWTLTRLGESQWAASMSCSFPLEKWEYGNHWCCWNVIDLLWKLVQFSRSHTPLLLWQKEPLLQWPTLVSVLRMIQPNPSVNNSFSLKGCNNCERFWDLAKRLYPACTPCICVGYNMVCKGSVVSWAASNNFALHQYLWLPTNLEYMYIDRTSQ